MKRSLFQSLLLVLLFAGCQQTPENPGPHPTSAAPTLTENTTSLRLADKDFTSSLPDELREAESHKKSSTINIDDKVVFAVRVHYDVLVDSPGYFRSVQLEVDNPVPVTEVGATIGEPINLGTPEQVEMAVPLIVTWRGDRWTRADQWTLTADGTLKQSQP